MANLRVEVNRRAVILVALAILVVIAAVVVLMVNMTGSSSPSAGPSSSTDSDGETEVVRWWSTSEDEVGSVVDNSEGNSADELTPNLGAYCQALDDTLAAGTGLFPENVDASTDAYSDSVTAFVREMQAMAPDEVHDAWQDLGSVMIAIVAAQGDVEKLDLPEDLTEASITSASNTISAHAQSDCGLSIE